MFFTLPSNDLTSAAPYPKIPKRPRYLVVCVAILHYANLGTILGLVSVLVSSGKEGAPTRRLRWDF